MSYANQVICCSSVNYVMSLFCYVELESKNANIYFLSVVACYSTKMNEGHVVVWKFNQGLVVPTIAFCSLRTHCSEKTWHLQAEYAWSKTCEKVIYSQKSAWQWNMLSLFGPIVWKHIPSTTTKGRWRKNYCHHLHFLSLVKMSHEPHPQESSGELEDVDDFDPMEVYIVDYFME